ncbi:hypothetical protein VDG1235_4565 [Verrucomicrobiia bacterium DG1235]|nr:hypothetical protein VDG1235_4565 [Verrucomicrobiae bacterium DG1235]
MGRRFCMIPSRGCEGFLNHCDFRFSLKLEEWVCGFLTGHFFGE